MQNWLDRNWRAVVGGFLMLVVAGAFALGYIEHRDKHAACVEALKSESVGDLARHLLCSQ